MKPLSKPTPSVTSSSVFSVEDSSTVTTPSVPTLVMRLADECTDHLVTRGHGRDLGDAVLVADRRCGRQQCLGHRVGGLGDAEPQLDGVGARGHVAQAGLDDRLCQHGGGGGAVACDVVGLGRHGLDQLRAEVLERILEVDLACDGDAVVGDDRAAERLGQHHVAAARTQGDADRVGELVDAGFHCPARSLVELNLLAHECLSGSGLTHAAPEITRVDGDLRGGTLMLTWRRQPARRVPTGSGTPRCCT